MDLPERTTYSFENAEVDAACGLLMVEGEQQYLRPKSFQVLLYLLENRDRLVPKDELIRVVWENCAVTDDAIVQCVKEVRRALRDDPRNPQFVKTFPKLGYRFISPVVTRANGTSSYHTEEITRLELEYEDDLPDIPDRRSHAGSFFSKHRLVSPAVLFSSVTFVLIVAAFSFAYFLRGVNVAAGETPLPKIAGKRTLAVMYFENQTHSAEFEWMREGLADMLITDLSRSSKLTVLSRGQLHLLLERNKILHRDAISMDKTLEVLRQVKAESVITGSFARLGEKVRLDVQILDAREGSVIATESLLVDSPEQILTSISLLSLKLAKHLGAAESTKQSDFADVMTDDLGAFRYYSLGIEKAQALHSKDAIELFEKAVALDPEFAMAHARIGYTYILGWGLPEKGKPYLEKAFKLSDRLNYRDRLNITAWYAIANMDFALAIATYRQIITEYPLESESYWRLGRLLSGEEQNDEAVQILQQGLVVDPDDKDLNNALGGLYSELGRHSEAISSRRRYVELAPAEPNAYDSLGLAYQWSGDYASAVASYNRALELDPEFDIALFHLANTRFQTGRYREAIDILQRAIRIAPSDFEKARGWEYIAQVQLRKGDRVSAEKASNKALLIQKEAASSGITIASLNGDFERAEKVYSDIFVVGLVNDRGARIKSRLAIYFRGFMALKKGEDENALTNFREGLRQKPPIYNTEAYEDCLANAYLELGRFDEAIAEYHRILRLNPNYPLVQFHLAQALQGKGMNAEALDAYRKFLEIWKDADTDIPEVLTAKKFVE